MSALAVVQDAGRSLEDLTLDELGVIVDKEHALVQDHDRRALHHAIACGAALLEARSRFGYGEWTPWVEDQGLPVHRACVYMRIARHQDALPDDVGVKGALHWLVGAPAATRPEHPSAPEIHDLRKAGMSYAQIAQAVGVSTGTVACVVSPENKLKKRAKSRVDKRRRRAALRALAEKERADAVAAKGGEIEKAYNLLRQAEQLVGRARPEVESREAKVALDEALASLARAIDKTWEAVRLG